MQASFRFNAKMAHSKSKITLPPNAYIYIYTCLWTKFIYHQKMSSNSEVPQKIIIIIIIVGI
jgi:hypothetical protein